MEKSAMIQGVEGNMFEEWLELRNGCLCCSVKDNGVKAIEILMKKRGKFDYILIETTGLADPGPIIKTFWLDKQLCSDVFLDGVVTVVDAKNCSKVLDRHDSETVNASVRQIALADVILLNKIDVVSEESALNSIKENVMKINSSALLVPTEHSKINLDLILDLGAYNTPSDERLKPLTDEFKGQKSHIDVKVGTVTVSLNVPFSEAALDLFMEKTLWCKELHDSTGRESLVYRAKGIVRTGPSSWVTVQAVYDTYEIEPYKKDDASDSLLVFIGEYLEKDKINELLSCCASSIES